MLWLWMIIEEERKWKKGGKEGGNNTTNGDSNGRKGVVEGSEVVLVL